MGPRVYAHYAKQTVLSGCVSALLYSDMAGSRSVLGVDPKTR